MSCKSGNKMHNENNNTIQLHPSERSVHMCARVLHSSAENSHWELHTFGVCSTGADKRFSLPSDGWTKSLSIDRRSDVWDLVDLTHGECFERMHTWCLVQVRCSQLGELYSVTVRRARCSLLMELENCALDTTVANNLLMASLLGVLRRELTESNLLITLTAETSRFKTMEASKIR